MAKKQVSLMINSTFYDMFGEYLVFIKEVYPYLKEFCKNHGIDLIYRDVAFSVPEEAFSREIILQDLRCIDEDRTFFICFRGQRVGWKPSPDEIDGITLNEYPELVDYIGCISITELAVLHALRPFDKCVGGKLTHLNPAKHALFYFRNPQFLNNLDECERVPYINKSNGMDKEVLDLEIAKAKDLIFDIKEEFDDDVDCEYCINIRQYDATFDENLDIEDLMFEYIEEYENLKGQSLDYFKEVHSKYLLKGSDGGLCDFKYGGKPLRDVMIEDIINALKMEFPENFE